MPLWLRFSLMPPQPFPLWAIIGLFLTLITQYRKLDGEQEARLVALACSAPPEGYRRWTQRVLADRLVELAVVERIGPEWVRMTLKKMSLNRGDAGTG